MSLFYCSSYSKDTKDYFENLAQQYPNFHFQIVISKPSDLYQGHRGHITEYLTKDFTSASDISAYLCGNRQMIEEGIQVLKNLGCLPDHLYHEKFY